MEVVNAASARRIETTFDPVLTIVESECPIFSRILREVGLLTLMD
jgi:hypothetical protein